MEMVSWRASISINQLMINLRIQGYNIIQKLKMAARMTKRLQKQFEAIQKNSDLKASLPTNDLKLWHVEFQGAKNTIYDGENFKLQLRFNNDYVTVSSSIAYLVP